VENGARCHAETVNEQVAAMVADKPIHPPHEISFRDLFLAQEEDDEEGASLAEVLGAIDAIWPNEKKFAAAEVARLVNDRSEYRIDVEKERAAAIREFFFAKIDQNRDVSGDSRRKSAEEPGRRAREGGDQTLPAITRIPAKSSP
jgi:hypothetical protein